jgi:anti-anti-sigma factor
MTVLQARQTSTVKEKRVRDRRKDYKAAEEWNRRSRLGLVEERRRSVRREEDKEKYQYLSWYREETAGPEEPRKIMFDRVNMLIRQEGRRKVIDFEGELSYADHVAIQNVIRDIASDDHEEVVLDLGNLSSIDTAGLGLIVGIHITHARKDKPVTVVNMAPSVHRMVVNCGIQKILTVK